MRTNRRTFPAAEIAPETTRSRARSRAGLWSGRAAGSGSGLRRRNLSGGARARTSGAKFSRRGTHARPGARGLPENWRRADCRTRAFCRRRFWKRCARCSRRNRLRFAICFFPIRGRNGGITSGAFSRRSFCARWRACLIPGGLLRVATDHAEYFAAMERIWPRVPAFEVCPPGGGEPGFTHDV